MDLSGCRHKNDKTLQPLWASGWSCRIFSTFSQLILPCAEHSGMLLSWAVASPLHSTSRIWQCSKSSRIPDHPISFEQLLISPTQAAGSCFKRTEASKSGEQYDPSPPIQRPQSSQLPHPTEPQSHLHALPIPPLHGARLRHPQPPAPGAARARAHAHRDAGRAAGGGVGFGCVQGDGDAGGVHNARRGGCLCAQVGCGTGAGGWRLRAEREGCVVVAEYLLAWMGWRLSSGVVARRWDGSRQRESIGHVPASYVTIFHPASAAVLDRSCSSGAIE